MNPSTDRGAVARWLAERSRLLLLAHERPDGDAYGATFGLAAALQARGCDCLVYLRRPVLARYRALLPATVPVAVGDALPMGRLKDGVVCLDTTEWKRLDLPPGIERQQCGPVCVIDHHPDHRPFGDVSWIDATQAATAQMVTRLLREAGPAIPAGAATCLLAGLAMDTGGFRHANTNPDVLRDAAFLVEGGADYGAVMAALFLRVPFSRRLLEARVLTQARFAHGGRLLYSILSADMLQDLGLVPEDTEGLIDVLKVDGIDIACLLQPDAEGVRLSFRSLSTSFPVNRLAQALGGGGHVLAAGAQLRGQSLSEAEARMLELTGRMIAGT